MARKKEQSALERFQALEQGVRDKQAEVQREIDEIEAKTDPLRAKIDTAIVEGGGDIDAMEKEWSDLIKRKETLHRRMRVLNDGYKTDTFINAAQAALVENAEQIQTVITQHDEMRAKLQAAFDAYLEVVPLVRPIEHAERKLQATREHLENYLKWRRQEKVWAGDIPRTNLDRIQGIPFLCTTANAIDAIKKAFNA